MKRQWRVFIEKVCKVHL